MLKLLFLFFCGGILGVAGETLCPPNETLVHGKCRPLVADVYCDNVKCGENMKCDEWNQCICLEGYMEYLDEDDGMKIKCANLQESVVDYTTENFFIGENFGSVESVKKFISTPDFGEVTESSKIGQKEKLEEPRENVKEKNFENEKFPKNSENQISNTGLKSEEYSSTRSPEKMLSEKPTLKSIENVLPSEVEVGEYFEQNSPQNPEKDLEIQDPDNNNNKSEVNLKNLEIENFSKYSQESKEYLPEHIENGAQSRDSLRNENAYSSENDISTEEEAYEFEHNSPQDPVEALETQDHEKNKNEVDFENQEIENFSKGSQENSNDPEPTLKEYIPEDIENGAQSQDSLRNENGYSSYIRNSPQNPGENLKIQTREENKSEVEIENFSKGLQEKSKDPQPILKENSVEHVENGAQSRDSLRNENGYGNENDISTEEEADKFERNFPQDPVEDLEKQGLEENKSEVDFNSRETENFSKGPKENSNDPQPTPKGYIPENMENGAQSQDSLRNENGYGNENDTSSEEVKEDFERNSPQNPEEDSEIQDSEENKSEVDFENRETENFSKGPQENSNDSQPTLKEYTLEPIENGAHSGGSLAKENGYANENVISSEEETNDFQRNSPQNPEKDSEIHGSEENKSEVDFENQEIENFSKGPQKNSKEPQPPEYTPEHMENGAQSENSLQNSEEDSEIQTREENKSEVDFENRETENFFKGPQENSNDPQSNLKENITEHIENGAHLGDSMTNRSGISEPESNRDQESHIEKMQVSPEQNQENPKKFGEYEHPTTTSQKEDKDIENPIDLETEVVSDDDERKISDAKPKENQELKMVNPADEKLPSPENNEKDISKQELDLGANNFLAEEFVTLPSWEEFEENLKLKENIEYRFQFHDPSSVTNKTLNEENERPLAPPEVEVKHKKANENHEPAILFSAIQNEPGSEGFFRESENSQNEKSLEPTNGDDSKIPTTTTTMEIKNLHLINSEEPLERDAQKISSEGGHDIIVPYNANLQVISEISELEQLSVGTESLKSLASETKNWTSTTQRSTSGEDLDSKKVYEADQNRHDEKRSDTIASEGGTEYRNSTTEVNPSGVSQANVTTEGEFNGESEENQSRHEEERPQSMSLGRGQIKIKEDSSTTTASERENEVRPNTTEKNLRSLAESSVPSEGELHEIFDENQSGIEKESRSSAASQDEREETSREQGQIPNEEESSERASEYRASTTERNVRGLAEANVPSEGEPNESLNENQSGIENENRSSTSSQGEREDTSIERGQIPKKEESLTIIALEREGEYRSSTTENNRRGLAESRMPSEGELHELFDENQGVIDKERRSFTASPSEREDTSRELETTDERTDSSENLDEVEVLSANQNRFVGSQMKMPEASKDRENEEDNSEEKQNHGEKENSFPTESEIEREYWLSTTEAVSNKFSVGNNVGSEENFNSDSNLPERDTRGEVESSKGSSEKNDDVRVLAEEQSAFVGSTMNISKDSREKESLEAEPSQQEGERLHSIASEFEREQAEIISNKSPNENITSEEKFVNSDFILPESVATKKSGTSTDFSENSKERTQDYKNYSEEKQSQEKEEKTSTTESEIGREYWHDTTEGLLNRFSIGKNVGLEEKLNSDSKLPEIKSLGEFETNNQKFSTDNQSQQESPTSTTSDSQREKLPRTIDNILEEEFSSKEKINSDSNHPEINTLEDMKKTEAITNSNFSDSSENFHDIEVLSENQNGFVGSHLKMLNVSKAEEIGGESEPQNKSQEIDLNGNIAIDQHPSSSANSSDVDEKKVKGKISQMDEEALMAPKMDKENGIGEKIQDLHNSRTSNPLAGETPENSGEETVIDKHMDVGEQNERPLAEINPNKNNNNEGYPDQDSKPGHDTYQIRGDIPTEFENDPSPEATREWEREKQLPERNFKKIQNKENNSQMQRELENKDSSTTSSLQGQTEPEHKETSTSNLQHQTEPEHKATSSPDSKGRQFVDQFSTTSTISHETQTEPEPKETLSLNGKEREFKSEELTPTSKLEHQTDPEVHNKNESLDHTQTLELQHQKAPAITHNSFKSQDPTNSGQEEENPDTTTSTLSGDGNFTETSTKADSEKVISTSQEKVLYPSIDKDESPAFIENIPSQISAQNTSQGLEDQNAIGEKILMRENILQNNVTTISPQYPDKAHRQEDPAHQEELSKKTDDDEIIFSSQEEVVDPSIGTHKSPAFIENILSQISAENASQDLKEQNATSEKILMRENILQHNVTTISPQYPEKAHRQEDPVHQEESSKKADGEDIISSSQEEVVKPSIGKDKSLAFIENIPSQISAQNASQDLKNQNAISDKNMQFKEVNHDIMTGSKVEYIPQDNVTTISPQNSEINLHLENTDHQENETENGLAIDDHKDPFVSPSFDVGVQQPTIFPQYPENVLPQYPEKELRLENIAYQESEAENGISMEDSKDPQYPEDVLPQYPEKELRLETTAHQESDTENGISMENKHKNPQYHEDVLPQYPQKVLRLENTAHQEIETENGITMEDHKDTFISKEEDISKLENISQPEVQPKIGGGGNLEITTQKSLPPTTADPSNFEMNAGAANPAGSLVPTTANPHLQNSTKSQGIVTNVKVTTMGPDSHTSRPIDPAAVGESTTGSPIHKSQGTPSKEDDYRKELSMENAVVVKTSSEDTSNDPGISVGHQILTDASGENTVPIGTKTGSTKGYDMPKDNNRNHGDFVENPNPIEDAKSPLDNGGSGEEKYYQEEDEEETEITTPTSGSTVTAVHNLEETQIKTHNSEPTITGILGIYIPENDMTNTQTEKPKENPPSESLVSEGKILVIHDPYNRPKPLPSTASPILNATKEMPKSMQEEAERKPNKKFAQNSNDYSRLDTKAEDTVEVVPNVPSRNHKAISNTTPKTMQQSLNVEQKSPNQQGEESDMGSTDPDSAFQTSSKPTKTNLKSDLVAHHMVSSTETMSNGLNASHPAIKGMPSEEINSLTAIDDKSQTSSTESVSMTTRNVPVGKIASQEEEEKNEKFSGNAISVSLNLHNSNKTSLELNPKYFGENVKENSNQTADDAPKNMLHISNKNPDMPVDKSHIASTESTLLEKEESSQVNGTSGNVVLPEIEFKTFNKSITEFAPKTMPHILNGHLISETQTPSTESSALQEREFSSAEENLKTDTIGSLTQDFEPQIPMDRDSVQIKSHGSSTVQNETLENELQASNANSNKNPRTNPGNQNSDSKDMGEENAFSTTEAANTLPRVPLSQNGDSQLRGNEMMSNSIIGNGDEKKIAFEAGRNSPTTVSPKDGDSSSNSSSSAHFVPEFKSSSNISHHKEEDAKSQDIKDPSSEIGVTFPTTLKPEEALEKTLIVESYSGTLNAKNVDDFNSEKIVNFSTTEAEDLLGEKNPPELISKVSSHGESATMEPKEILRLKNVLDSKLPKANATTPEDSHSKENLTTTTNEPGTTSPTTAEASVPLRIPTYLNAENPPKNNANGNDNSSIGSTGQNLDSQATEFTSPGIEEIILINAENPLKNNSHGDEYSLIGSTGQNLDNQTSELTTPSIGPEIEECNLINAENPLKNNSLGAVSTIQNLDNQASEFSTPSIGSEFEENNSENERKRGENSDTTILREIIPHTENSSEENPSLKVTDVSENTTANHKEVKATEFDLSPRLESNFATKTETNKNSDNSLPDSFSTTTTNDFQSSTENSHVAMQEVEPKTLGEMAGHFSMDIDFDEIPDTTTSQEEIIISTSRRDNTLQFEASSEVAESSKNSKSRNAFEEVTRLSANISKGLENNLTLDEFGTSTPKISVELPINPTSDQTLKEVGTSKISEELPNNSTSDQELEDTLIPSTTPNTNEDILEMFNNKNRTDEKIENSLKSNSLEEASSSSSKIHNFDPTTTSIFEKIFKQLSISDTDTKEIENSSESNSSKEAASASSSFGPHKFDEYDTTATSISEELYKTFKKQPHNFSDRDTKEIEKSSESNFSKESGSSSSSLKTHNFDRYDTTATSIFEELYKTFKQQDSSSDTETKEIEKSSESNSSDEAASASSSSKTYNFDDYDTTATSIFEEFYKTFKQQGSFPNTDIKEIEKSSESNSSKEAASSFSSSEPHNLDEYETVTTSIFQELYKTFKQQHNISDTEKQKPPPQTTTERTGNFSGTDNQSKNQTTSALPLSEGILEGKRDASKKDKNSSTTVGNTEVLNVNKTFLSGGENSDKETISSNTNKYNTEQDATTVRNNYNKILIGKTHKEREKILRESGAYETTTTEYHSENNNNTTSTTKESNHSKLTTVLRTNITTLPPIHAKEEHHIPKNRRKPIITYAPPLNENEHENSTQPNELSEYCLKPENICSPLCCGENTICSSQQGCQCREGFREMVGENTTTKHCVAVTAEPHKIPSSYIFIGVICLILALIYMSVKYFNVTQVGRHNV